MSFADIINSESKKLEEGNGGNDKVKYPETKQKPLYFEKNQREILVQVLPSKDLVSMFVEPIRKIFLSAVSSGGKQINCNFTLDAEPNAGSLLEQKIQEWASKKMIPSGFGGQQSPKRLFLANVVRVIQNPANPNQWVQERDAQGNLVVRKFELPQSAFQNLLRKLGDKLYNVSGTELSFMDINRPSPIKISKPAKGQMEYPVEVYSTIILPPLGQGWENLLEDLKAQAVPTERLENGDKWVQAFVDMKEGRKPNQGGQSTAPQDNPYAAAPQNNPYAPAPQVNGYAPAPQNDPYANLGTPQQPVQPNPYAAPQPNPYAAAPQPNPYTVTPQAPVMPQAPQAPQANPFTAPPAPQIDYSGGIGEETDINSLMPTGMPSAPAPAAPTPAPAPTMPAHANANGLNDIDSMLARELGNL